MRFELAAYALVCAWYLVELISAARGVLSGAPGFSRTDSDQLVKSVRLTQVPGSRLRGVFLSGEMLLVSTAEHACYNPKDSELCLARAKPQETGVEARSRCDVQIHGVSWA